MSLRSEARLLARLAGLLREQLASLALAAFSSLAAGATLLALGATLRRFVDQGVHRTLHSLNAVTAEMGALVVVYALAAYLRSLLTGVIGERVSNDLRKRALDRLLQHGPGYFEARGPNRIWSQITQDCGQVQASTTVALSGCRSAVVLAGGLAIMIYSNLLLSLVVVLLAPPITFSLFRLHGALRAVAARAQAARTEAEATALESLAQIRTVKAFSQEARLSAAFAARSDAALAQARSSARLQGLVSASSIAMSFGAAVLIAWIAGGQILHARATEGAMTAFLFYAVATANAGAGLADAWGQLQRGLGAAERLFALFDDPVAVAAPPAPARLSSQPCGLVEFNSVSFRYSGRSQRSALDQFDLRVEPGRSIALVGRSGAGKSTVFNLLLRLYDPTTGAVRLDGHDLRSLSPQELRRHIALVPQDHALFDGTIRENILYGDPAACDQAVRRAAEAALVFDFAGDQSGLDSPVGHRGEALSGGQRQRVAIARALLRRPAILLLDEATSALDPHALAHVQKSFAQLSARATTLIIAHQLQTARQADEIVMLIDGKLAGRGVHEDLLASLPAYQAWVRLAEQAPADGL